MQKRAVLKALMTCSIPFWNSAVGAQEIDTENRPLSSQVFNDWRGELTGPLDNGISSTLIPKNCFLKGSGVLIHIARFGFVGVELSDNTTGQDLFAAEGIEVDGRTYLLRRTSVRTPSVVTGSSDSGVIETSSFRGFISVAPVRGGAWLPMSTLVAALAEARSVTFRGSRDGTPYRFSLPLNGLANGLAWCDRAFKYAK